MKPTSPATKPSQDIKNSKHQFVISSIDELQLKPNGVDDISPLPGVSNFYCCCAWKYCMN